MCAAMDCILPVDGAPGKTAPHSVFARPSTPKCGSRMEVIALILDPAEIRKIINCLAKHGRGSPTAG